MLKHGSVKASQIFPTEPRTVKTKTVLCPTSLLQHESVMPHTAARKIDQDFFTTIFKTEGCFLLGHDTV
jgi:hypothetical protein